MRSAAVLLLVALTASCATLRRPPDPRGLDADTPAAAWTELAEIRAAFPGARAFLTIDPERGRRFDATLAVDGEGRIALEGLSPLGTTLFGIYGEGERLLFVNERERTWWEGTFEQFAARTGLFRGIHVSRAADLGLILLGIPPEEAILQDAWATAASGIRYRVERTGLAEVLTPGNAARVLYLPAAYPPVRVRLVSAGSTLEIYHHEIVSGATEVTIAQPDASWTCCVLPRIVDR
jgi:hypothetical protein